MHGRGHAALHLARVRRLHSTLIAETPLQQRWDASPAPPTAHRFTTMAHPRHAGTSVCSSSSLRRAAQSLERHVGDGVERLHQRLLVIRAAGADAAPASSAGRGACPCTVLADGCGEGGLFG